MKKIGGIVVCVMLTSMLTFGATKQSLKIRARAPVKESVDISYIRDSSNKNEESVQIDSNDEDGVRITFDPLGTNGLVQVKLDGKEIKPNAKYHISEREQLDFLSLEEQSDIIQTIAMIIEDI